MSTRKRPSLTTLIFLGIGLGILVGLFLGELAAPLSVLGTAFVRLLQMTVLPYVLVSLLLGLGRQQPDGARAIAKSGGLWLVVLWTFGLSMALALPIAFPDWQSAAFFSSSLVEVGEGFDLVGLYIPANPFFALAENLVPAVVVFSVCLGVALIGLPEGSAFIDALEGANGALTRVANSVVKLTPIGVFGIAANAAGTISPGQLEQLQVFILTYMTAALFLAFWVIPGLISAVTPLSHRSVISVSRDALLTAFATGSVFVVLPILAQRAKTLLAEAGVDPAESDGVVEVVLPASFSFPTAGALLSLSFVLFAGWFTGATVDVGEYPQFAISALLSAFGGAIVAIPFLLDQMRISADTFDLYVVVSQVVSVRFSSLLAAVHILGLTLLCAATITGKLEVRWPRVLRFAGITIGGAIVLLLGVRTLFTYGIDYEYVHYDQLVGMEVRGPTARVRSEESLNDPADARREGESTLDRIRRTGTLRVGYASDRLPYAYRNAADRVVGLDAELMHLLAFELGVELAFVKLENTELSDALSSGRIDIMGSGTVITVDRLLDVSFTAPYSTATLSFLVPDHLRAAFSSSAALRELESPVIGTPDLPYLVRYLEEQYPNAVLEPIDGIRPFLRGNEPHLDAIAYAAEAGSAWTLIYPAFSVAVPYPDVISIPIAYPVAAGDERMVEFLDNWLQLKRQDGTLKRLDEYWMQGKLGDARKRRWSVIRDVLGWVP